MLAAALYTNNTKTIHGISPEQLVDVHLKWYQKCNDKV